MAHKFDPAAAAARQQAKKDFEAHIKANPSPNSIAKLLERLKLFEAAKG